MHFLIDENLPISVGQIFLKRGAGVECALEMPDLRSKPDELIFEYAVTRRAILVTRDLGFTNPERFDVRKLQGVVILRFPNEISISMLCDEIEHLTQDFRDADFCNLIVIEPGSLRKREL
ncbi:MAG TPA: DUF5615 family PIN-like protein [Candidatus Paceibacterota bacterium]|nr:DUF5615 family PIN-like protein [Candidatus Paceibacterota bacterium]